MSSNILNGSVSNVASWRNFEWSLVSLFIFLPGNSSGDYLMSRLLSNRQESASGSALEKGKNISYCRLASHLGENINVNVLLTVVKIVWFTSGK